MGIQQKQLMCKQCGRLSLYQRKTANHIAHALISILLIGLWIPIWILAAVSEPPLRCQSCGRASRGNHSAGAGLARLIVAAVFATIAGIAIYVYMNDGF